MKFTKVDLLLIFFFLLIVLKFEYYEYIYTKFPLSVHIVYDVVNILIIIKTKRES